VDLTGGFGSQGKTQVIPELFGIGWPSKINEKNYKWKDKTFVNGN